MSIIEGVVVGADTGFYTTEIEQSLRFNDDDSAYLSWTPASTGNRKTWTWSSWYKAGKVNTAAGGQSLFYAGNSVTTERGGIVLSNAGNQELSVNCMQAGTTSNVLSLQPTANLRDPSSWYHFVVSIDTTQATASDRAKIYVNGVRVTDFVTATYPSQNTDLHINGAGILHATKHPSNNYYIDGYLAETHFIDGTAYDATAFGEFKNGVWIPKTPSVTYGTNGFYLDYSNGASIGADSSGNGNNWTPTNLASTDVMLDSPTNNFATLNPDT